MTSGASSNANANATAVALAFVQCTATWVFTQVLPLRLPPLQSPAICPQPPPKQAAATTRAIPPPAAQRGAPAAGGNAPMSLSPDSAQASLPPAAAEPRTRMAATASAQTAAASDAAPATEGRFLVQVSSQKTEADAQASFRALQKKFPDALGSQSPLIKRADLGGDKGTVYRAMVGPFGSREEAVKFCMGYKSAGGQCYIP